MQAAAEEHLNRKLLNKRVISSLFRPVCVKSGCRLSLTCVGASVYFEVLQPGKTFAADGTLVWFLVGVRADVDQHLVPVQGRHVLELPHAHLHTKQASLGNTWIPFKD